MLARRFTAVCLTTMIFGMGLALLVAEDSRSHRVGRPHAPATCLFEISPACSDELN